MALREIKALYLVLASAALLLCNKGECSSFGARRGLAAAVETVFDVTKFGARPDGRTDGSLVRTICIYI